MRKCGEAVTPLKALSERLVADDYLSLRALAAYSGLSVRTLRSRLADASHPLPHYRIGGSIRVRRSEYDAWVQRFRRSEENSAQVVRELLRGM